MPTKSSVFVDTSGWADPLAHASPSHAAMQAYYQRLIATKRPLITTNYVIAELVALLTARARLARPRLLTIVNRIRQMPQLTVVYVDHTLDAEAWRLLEQYDATRSGRSWTPSASW